MEVDASQFNNATPNDIIELIKQTLSGDNQKIKSATKILKAYTKHKSSISTLTYILVNSQDLGYRQMATVLLKRNLVNLYGNLGPNQQKQFRDLLLSQYIKQTHLLIQKGIANLISILLPVVEIKNWVQLQSLLDQAIRSAPQSAATFVLLNSLLYHFTPPKELYIYLFNALKIQKLVEQAIKCVNAVVQTQDVDPSFATQLIKIWQQQSWHQDLSLQAFQILTSMVQRKFKLPDQVTIWVCDKIVSNRKLSNKLRTAGCDFLFTIAEFSPKLITAKDSLLKKVVQTACFTCSQPYHPDQEEAGQYVQQIALWLIETLSITIKAKKIYPVLFEAAISLINSTDKNQANTGFLILGSMCQGCTDKIKKNLQNPIMNVLIPKGLQHQAPEVRGAAINALCFFSQHLIPDIFEYHGVIIPAMMKYIGDLSPKVIQKALIAIDIFLDGMDQEDIVQYLPAVVPKLIEVLTSEKSTSLMRAAAMSGLGSAVTASQQKFQPYVEIVLQTCNKVLDLNPSPQLNSVRAQNLNVLGKLANAFCKPQYKNSQLFYNTYIMPIMERVYKILINQKDNQMRESSFAFFYLIANAIGGQFQVVFDNIINEVLDGCKLLQPLKKQKKANDFSLDSDSQEQADALPTNKVTAYDEKAAAIHALGQLAKACPLKFVPYFQRAHAILQENYQFFYENIRIQVCHCMTNITIGYIKSKNGGQLPKYKKGLPCIDRFTTQIEEHFRTSLIPRFIFMMTEDQDKRVKGAAIEALDDLCKQIGPVLVDRSIEPLKDAIIRLLESDVVEQDSEEQQQPEDQQTQVHTFETLCDLIPTLCDILRSGFQPSLLDLHPYLMKFLEQREDVNDNVQMAGCLSQCFKFIPDYVNNHAQQLFKSLAHLISLWQTDVNRNIAYAFAEMFEKAPKTMMPYLQDGLSYLKQIFDHASSSQACKDNAVGAICRIIYTFNPPFPYQIFVQNLVKIMPFQGDQEEESVALKGLLFLWKKDQNLLLNYKQRIVQILENDLSNASKYKIEQPLTSELSSWLNNLRQ